MDEAKREHAPVATVSEQWIVTANALADGGVRYLTVARGWTADLQQAWFGPKEAAEAMLTWSRTQEHVVCDPYVFALDRADGALVPRTQREIIRAEGPAPTLRRLGLQRVARLESPPAPARRAV